MITSFDDFRLCDYTHLFTKTTEKDKYICPICGGHNLSIKPNSPVFNCFNSDGECNSKIMAFALEKSGLKESKQSLPSKPSPEKKIELYASTKTAKVAKELYEQILDFESGERNEIVYPYEDLSLAKCGIIRRGLGEKKTFKNATWEKDECVFEKINPTWYPFNHHLLHHAKGKSILITEGEKDAIATQALTGILTTCLPNGGNHLEKKLLFSELKRHEIISAVYIYDNDLAGKNKAKSLKKSARDYQFYLQILPITFFDNDLPEKGDLFDYLTKSFPFDIKEKKNYINKQINLYKSELCSTITSIENKAVIRTSSEINIEPKKGNSLAKYVEILKTDFAGRFKFNELLREVELDNKPADLDLFHTQIFNKYSLNIGRNNAYDFAVNFAKENSYHPVRDYLNGIKDDTTLINIRHLSAYFFYTVNPLFDTMLYKFLIGSVARIYHPGCKMDTALILQGKQGIGKSSFFSSIFGEKFHNGSLGSTSRDDLLIMSKSWCSEFAELESITSKKQAGEVKAFLSCATDIYREPYARTTKSHPRQSVICGTVNDCQFLTDVTGNRRFWVIPVNKEIDTKEVEKLRDSIWYQAKLAYEAGEKWWLTREDEKESEELNQVHLHDDSWDSEKLDNHLRGLELIGVTVRDLLIKQIEIEEKDITKIHEMRIAKILSRKGWTKKRVRKGAVLSVKWYCDLK